MCFHSMVMLFLLLQSADDLWILGLSWNPTWILQACALAKLPGGKIFLLWNMYVVLSRKMCRGCWAAFHDLSFMKNACGRCECCRSRASARLGKNQSRSPGGGIIHLHWDVSGFQRLPRHWIKGIAPLSCSVVGLLQIFPALIQETLE